MPKLSIPKRQLCGVSQVVMADLMKQVVAMKKMVVKNG